MSAKGGAAPRKVLGALGWGVVAGAVSPVLILLGAWTALELGPPDPKAPAFNVELVSAGADVSRHGGMRVVLANERGAIAQTCRGACDDLRVRQNTGYNVYWARVLDAKGACVVCDPTGAYVANGYDASVATLIVGGREKLTIRQTIHP